MTLPSRSLGKYEIVAEIGSGGFGTVYKARDASLDRMVALKVLHPHLLHDRAFVERFQREARTAASLFHARIVTIYEISEIEGVYFISMRFLEGKSLDKVLQDEGPLPLERTAAILGQVAAALDYAHGQGVLHRDIKPSNIIIAPDGTATLTDFGLARATGQSGLTSASQVLGTPYYMAPEMLDEEREKKLDYRADLYSLGVVAYEMVTGRVPFGGGTPAVIAGHLNKQPPRASEISPGIAPSVEAVLDKALAKDPSHRYQRAGDMAATLGALENGDQGVMAAQTEPSRQQAALARPDTVPRDRVYNSVRMWTPLESMVPRWRLPPEGSLTLSADSLTYRREGVALRIARSDLAGVTKGWLSLGEGRLRAIHAANVLFRQSGQVTWTVFCVVRTLPIFHWDGQEQTDQLLEDLTHWWLDKGR